MAPLAPPDSRPRSPAARQSRPPASFRRRHRPAPGVASAAVAAGRSKFPRRHGAGRLLAGSPDRLAADPAAGVVPAAVAPFVLASVRASAAWIAGVPAVLQMPAVAGSSAHPPAAGRYRHPVGVGAGSARHRPVDRADGAGASLPAAIRAGWRVKGNPAPAVPVHATAAGSGLR